MSYERRPDPSSAQAEEKEKIVKSTRIVVMVGARMEQKDDGSWNFPLVASTQKERSVSLGEGKYEIAGGTSRLNALSEIY